LLGDEERDVLTCTGEPVRIGDTFPDLTGDEDREPDADVLPEIAPAAGVSANWTDFVGECGRDGVFTGDSGREFILKSLSCPPFKWY
jgi:hypothetical protein